MKCRYRLTLLTPVFIGNGDTLTRIDYAFDPERKVVSVLKPEAFIGELEKKKLVDDYIFYLQKNKNRASIQHWLRDKKMLDILKGCTDYELDTKSCATFAQANEIRTFIKDVEGRPYIPGSSLKGAIVSALIDRSLIDWKNDASTLKDPRRNNEKDFFEASFGRQRSEEGGIAFNVLPFIHVSDSEPLERDRLTLVQKEDLDTRQEDPAPKALPLFRESLVAGSSTTFTLTLLPGAGVDHKDLEIVIRNRFLRIFGKSGVIGKLYPQVVDYIPPLKNLCCLVLGGGTGFHTKTNLMAIYGTPEAANEEARKYLQSVRAFEKHHHETDRPISPRALKLGHSDKKDRLLGICQLKRVEEA